MEMKTEKESCEAYELYKKSMLITSIEALYQYITESENTAMLKILAQAGERKNEEYMSRND